MQKTHFWKKYGDTILILLFIVLLFVCLPVGMIGLFVMSVIMLRKSIKNKKRGIICSNCHKKLTLWNTGAGGDLADGGQLCTHCYHKFSTDIALDSSDYTFEEMIEAQKAYDEQERTKQEQKKEYEIRCNKETDEKWKLLQYNKKFPIIKPILEKDEVIENLIPAKYFSDYGTLTLTNQRLLFVYDKPIKKIASSGFLSTMYYNDLCTHEIFLLGLITDVQVKSRFSIYSLNIFMHGFVSEIECFCFRSAVNEMAAKIMERAKQAAQSNDPINIQINVKLT